MLETLRNAGKTWVAKILLFLLAASFGVWGIRDIFGGFRAGSLVSVAGQEISAQEYTTSFRQALQNYSRQVGQPISAEEAHKAGFDRSVLNNLIQTKAIDAQAQNLNLHVATDVIRQQTESNRAFFDSNGKFDQRVFASRLQQQGITEDGFIAMQTRDLTRGAITSVVNQGIVPPKTLVNAIYQYNNEQRDTKYFKITASEADVAAPTDEELKKQYEAYPAAYTAPEYRSIAMMKVEPADVAPKITITADDLEAGYEKYKADYFTPEKRTILQLSFPSVEEAQKAKDKLAAGTDFMVLAKERGATEADVTFADKTKSDFLDPVIADAAFGLKEGEVSGPVSGKLVTALVKAVKIAPEKQATLDEVKDALTKRLQNERALDEIQSITDTVENARNSRDKKFEEIAKEQGIPFILIDAVSAAGQDKAGQDVDVTDKQDILKAAFGSDVGIENEPLSSRDGYFWYEVRSVVPSALKPLDAVKDQVKSDVLAAKVRELLTQRATKLVADGNAGSTLEQLATANAGVIKTAQGLKRQEANGEFDVPSVTALFSVPEKGFAWSLEGDGKSAKIMQSQPVLTPPLDAESETAKNIIKNISGAASQDLLVAYLGDLQSKAGVSINETLWQQVSGTQQPSP
jgi:peptidyl-prolyl cis-trans isomerase D